MGVTGTVSLYSTLRYWHVVTDKANQDVSPTKTLVFDISKVIQPLEKTNPNSTLDVAPEHLSFGQILHLLCCFLFPQLFITEIKAEKDPWGLSVAGDGDNSINRNDVFKQWGPKSGGYNDARL